MKSKIELSTWNRKQHFELFSAYLEPMYGLTVDINCDALFRYSKSKKESFYFNSLYYAARASNTVDAFKLRIEEGEVFRYDRIDLSAVIAKPDGTFGFSLIEYHDDISLFRQYAEAEAKRVQESNDLFPNTNPNNVIHYSSLPWLKFTSLSHARPLKKADSCPKITFGKVFLEKDLYHMPVSIHVHHGLVDGKDIAEYIQVFTQLMS